MADFIIKSAAGTGNKTLIQGQDQSGSNYAVQVNDAGATTLTNATITAGTFPTGHIIKSGLLVLVRDTTAVSSTSTSFTDSGIAGSITTVKSSSDSRLIFKLYRGMTHIADGQNGQSTMTLRSSSSTSYAIGDDLVSSTNSYYNYINGGIHKPRYEEIHYKAGTSTPSNLTSYSAGDTLYWRYFYLTSANTYYFIHIDTHYSVEYQEVAL